MILPYFIFSHRGSLASQSHPCLLHRGRHFFHSVLLLFSRFCFSISYKLEASPLLSFATSLLYISGCLLPWTPASFMCSTIRYLCICISLQEASLNLQDVFFRPLVDLRISAFLFPFATSIFIGVVLIFPLFPILMISSIPSFDEISILILLNTYFILCCCISRLPFPFSALRSSLLFPSQ